MRQNKPKAKRTEKNHEWDKILWMNAWITKVYRSGFFLQPNTDTDVRSINLYFGALPVTHTVYFSHEWLFTGRWKFGKCSQQNSFSMIWFNWITSVRINDECYGNSTALYNSALSSVVCYENLCDQCNLLLFINKWGNN